MAPAPMVKQRCEVQDDRGEAGWQDRHGGVSWRGHTSHNGQIAPPLNSAANGQSRGNTLFCNRPARTKLWPLPSSTVVSARWTVRLGTTVLLTFSTPLLVNTRAPTLLRSLTCERIFKTK